METQGRSIISRLMFWKKGMVFSHGVLEGDILRIIRKYQQAGFLHAEIVEKDLVFDDNNKNVTIYITIKEGLRVKVSSVSYIIDDEIDLDYSGQFNETIIRKSGIREGSYFNDQDFLDDLNIIAELFDDYGYPSIKTHYELNLNDDESLVDIEIYISPGHRAYYSDITFTGGGRTDTLLLEKFLLIEKNEAYDPSKIKSSRARLQALGLFRIVSINLEYDRETGHSPVEILLQELPAYSLVLGTGYGIEDNVRIYAELTKMRFLGGLRRGSVFVKHSALEPVHLNLKMIQPAFINVNTTLLMNTYYRYEKEPAYSLKITGAETLLSHSLSDNIRTYFSYKYEYNDLRFTTDRDIESDFADGLSHGGDDWSSKYYTKSLFNWGILLDVSGPDFYPESGYLLSNIFTLSGYGFRSDYRFLRWLGEARLYNRLAGDLVLALRGKAGAIRPLEDDRYIPIEERFFSGGAYSVRGWSRSMLGPKNEEGKPVGGNSLLEGSIEFRHPLWHELSGVVFLDMGNVWSGTFEHNISNVHYAAGLGLRYATPIGPVRLDLATPVFEGRTSWHFFISIGHAF